MAAKVCRRAKSEWLIWDELLEAMSGVPGFPANSQPGEFHSLRWLGGCAPRELRAHLCPPFISTPLHPCIYALSLSAPDRFFYRTLVVHGSVRFLQESSPRQIDTFASSKGVGFSPAWDTISRWIPTLDLRP